MPDRRRTTHSEAARQLARLDPVMADLVAQHGLMRLPRRAPVNARFERLARAIVYQQLAGKAAAAIWGRVSALAGPDAFTPERVLALGDDQLRGAGLSGSKLASLRDLADKVASGQVRLERLGRMDDDAVVAELTQVRGIGPWTAHMVLMFDLHRLDVWPVGDYGVRNGFRIAYGLPELPTEKELLPLGEPFHPYRSVAAWYCWRAVDGAGGV